MTCTGLIRVAALAAASAAAVASPRRKPAPATPGHRGPPPALTAPVALFNGKDTPAGCRCSTRSGPSRTACCSRARIRRAAAAARAGSSPRRIH